MSVGTRRAAVAVSSTAVAAGLVVGGLVAQSSAATTLTKTVTISGSAYHPSTLTIKKGTTVVWVNKDGMPHTVTSNTGAFPGKTLGTSASSRTYRFTFTKVGRFSYHCSFHPFMHGTVVVTK